MRKAKSIFRKRIAVLTGICTLLTAVVISVAVGFFFSNSPPVKYEDTVLQYARQYNVPAALVLSVIKTESNFDPQAVSYADARGLMQITPETFEWLQTKTGENLSDDALFEPEISIKYGTFFLSILLERFEVIDTAVAAYNAGMNAVARWLNDPEYSDDGKNLKQIPYGETSYYVVKVNRSLKEYKELYDF